MDVPASAPAVHQPPQPRRPSLSGLGWRRAETETETPEPGPADLPSSLSDPQPPPPPSAGASAAPLDAPLDPDGSDQPSSTGSTPSRPRVKVVKVIDTEALRDTTVHVITGAGDIAHVRLAQDAIDEHLGVWKVNDNEADQIGIPISNLVARHSNGVAGMANPDLADGIAALMGIASYFGRQMKLRKIAKLQRSAFQLESDEAQSIPRNL